MTTDSTGFWWFCESCQHFLDDPSKHRELNPRHEVVQVER